jgi:hypothetical protein
MISFFIKQDSSSKNNSFNFSVNNNPYSAQSVTRTYIIHHIDNLLNPSLSMQTEMSQLLSYQMPKILGQTSTQKPDLKRSPIRLTF